MTYFRLLILILTICLAEVVVADAGPSGIVNVGLWNRPNQIIAMQTTLIVPPMPSDTGTLFVWPGLEPGQGAHGVLQPVLTWGPSCAPGQPPPLYSQWWISGQYVHNFPDQFEPHGCSGGEVMPVNVGDELKISMQLSGTKWRQVITDATTRTSVSFDLEMQGQQQRSAIFEIEEWSGAKPINDITFLHTTVIFDQADPENCVAISTGTASFNPSTSDGGKTCYFDQITLRKN